MIPLWIKASLTILLGIAFGVWFTGEASTRFNERFLIDTKRADVQLAVDMLAGRLVPALVSRDAARADSIIRQYTSAWSNLTFVHVLDDEGRFFTEWQRKPVRFGEGILKFESSIEVGAQLFGTASVYVDLNDFQSEMEQRTNESRRRAALLLLAIAMVIIFVVNYVAIREAAGGRTGADENQPGPGN